jgi:hypothetical protein
MGCRMKYVLREFVIQLRLECYKDLLVVDKHCIGAEKVAYGAVELGLCVVVFAQGTKRVIDHRFERGDVCYCCIAESEVLCCFLRFCGCDGIVHCELVGSSTIRSLRAWDVFMRCNAVHTRC